MVFGQDEGLRFALDYKINKMKKELHLTEDQADAVRPIIKDYMVKRQELLAQTNGQSLVDHDAFKSALKGLKDVERQALSKILSEEQMKTLINKETLMAALNPDSLDTSYDEGTTLTPNGADFKF